LAGLDLAEALLELLDLAGRRGELPLEIGGLRADPFLSVVDVRLSPPERGVLGGGPRALLGEALLALDEPRFTAGEILLAPLQLVVAALRATVTRHDVLFGLRELALPRREVVLRLGELVLPGLEL